MNAKESSLERAKATTLRLADLCGELLVEQVPGGSTALKLAKSLAQHAGAYYQSRGERRLVDFHRSLLGSLSEEERTDLIHRNIDAEAYYAILTQLIQDEEDAKLGYYVKLMKAIVEQDYSPRFKRTVVKLFRALTKSEMDLLVEVITVYRQAKEEGVAAKVAVDQHLDQKLAPLFHGPRKNLSTMDGALSNLEIQNLLRSGCLAHSRRGANDPSIAETPRLTPLGREIARILE